MCDLYSLTKSQDDMRRITGALRHASGNLPPLPAIFPDQVAPVVRDAEGEHGLTMMGWGLPPPHSKYSFAGPSCLGPISPANLERRSTHSPSNSHGFRR